MWEHCLNGSQDHLGYSFHIKNSAPEFLCLTQPLFSAEVVFGPLESFCSLIDVLKFNYKFMTVNLPSMAIRNGRVHVNLKGNNGQILFAMVNSLCQ